LAAAADRESMLQLVAMTVGVSARAGTTLEQGIADFVQSKQLLLVLDNCEHLLDAASELVELLVQQSADARVLVTSREGLGVVGEQIWPLRSLPVAADAAAASDAAQLFEDRARAARPDFVLDGNNAATVVELCRRLDGIPLAIELAAARVAAMSPAEIADLLDERFRLLTGGRRTAVERHQTLRATVDWSYSLLTDTERVVFDRLGVFAGSFDVHAAAAVAVGDGVERWDVLDSLVSLVAKSMVVAEDVEPGTTRYQLLETLRQYARERLDGAGLADDVRRRHATHYAERAEALVPRLQGAEEIAARRQIGADLDDLRAAVFWAADSQADGELAVRVVAALASESIQNQQAGIGSWAVRIVPLARLSTAGRRFAALGAAASQYVTVGDYESARRHGNDAIVQPTPPDCSFPYLPYFALQQIEAYEGRPEAAYDLAVSSREQLEADGADAFSIAVLYGCAAVWAISANNLDLACAEADEALRRGRVLQNPTVLGTALFDLGWALADTDPERALASFEEHIDLVRRGGGDGAFAPSLAMVSALWARRGDLSTAVARFDESVEFALRGGLPVTFVGCLNYGIEMLATSGRHDACALLYGVVRVGPIESAIAGYYTSPSWTGAIDDAKRVLGAERFDALVAEGAAMSYDEVAGWIRALLDDLRAVVTNS
ncbi:MAG TPA: hypothetical protein VEP49_21870, partial [Acidimicrobiia bacterium]|nr:hypothetical protein [Acidimicrobiia bacterium]